MAQGNAGTPGQGRVIRFDGTQEEAFPAWRMWAKAHLRTRTRVPTGLLQDGTAAIENEEELAAELITLIVPESPAWEAIRHLADDMETMIFTRGGLQRVAPNQRRYVHGGPCAVVPRQHHVPQRALSAGWRWRRGPLRHGRRSL